MSIQEILAEIPKLSNAEIELLEKALQKREVKLPTLVDLVPNLLDGVDDLPGDLRTNPKHMEGFGK